MSDELHDHDRGLAADIEVMSRQMLARRGVLRLLGMSGAGLAAAACGGGGSDTTTSTSTGGSSGGGSSSGTSGCITTVGETEGPYPADGSNSSGGVVRNVLSTTGVVRSDIRTSIGGVSTNTASGVPITLKIKLGNSNSSCAPLAGYAIYIWHCTVDGKYSLYDLPNENYLRGVLVTDSNGEATFTTIFPGCYSGRWPHIHFEIYPSLPVATSYRNKVLTSQFAMPAATCSAVYSGSSLYASSVSTFARVSLSSDNVFADNSSDQITQMTPVFTGSVATGLSATVTVGILP